MTVLAWRRASLIAAVLVISGCAEYSADSDAPSAGATNATESDASAPALDSGSQTSTTGPQPRFFALALSFETAEGEIVEGTAAVTVDLWSDESPPSLLCRHDVPVLAAVAEPLPALDSLETDTVTGAGGLVGWWRLDLDVGAPDGPCPEWAERTLWFGLGPYDSRLDPSLDAAGLFGAELFGLYLEENPGEGVFVVGIGGTAEMFAGGYGPDPVAAPPLADGAYSAESLVLMSL
jgi:hypothetical protein